MKLNFLAFFLLLLTFILADDSIKTIRPSLVDFDAYEKLIAKVKNHRAERLLNLDEFLKAAKEKNVIIIDARSEKMYQNRHLKGAINLNFSDFSTKSLAQIIPTKETKILIYCNNNFEGDEINMVSKIALPKSPDEKPLMLALNVPTYINLFGYGYQNVYELSELINIKDKRLEWEGKSVLNFQSFNGSLK